MLQKNGRDLRFRQKCQELTRELFWGFLRHVVSAINPTSTQG